MQFYRKCKLVTISVWFAFGCDIWCNCCDFPQIPTKLHCSNIMETNRSQIVLKSLQFLSQAWVRQMLHWKVWQKCVKWSLPVFTHVPHGSAFYKWCVWKQKGKFWPNCTEIAPILHLQFSFLGGTKVAFKRMTKMCKPALAWIYLIRCSQVM